MSIDLAALQDAAEALGEAARATDEGRSEDARLAATRASLNARVAFGIGAIEVGGFDQILAAVTDELTVGGVVL